MYSSRMRTARALPYGGSLSGGLHDRDPPGQRPPPDRDPLNRDPRTEITCADRDPFGQRPPWTETSPSHVTCGHAGTETPPPVNRIRHV